MSKGMHSNNAGVPPDSEPYQGYHMLNERELLALHDQQFKRETGKLSPWQKARTLKTKMLSLVLFISFVLIVVWQVLVATCRVSRLCSVTDLSSQQDSEVAFRTFRFQLPSTLLWIGLVFGSFILFASSLLTIRLNKSPIRLKNLEYIGFFIRQASGAILLSQYVVIFIPVFLMFFIVGFIVSWPTAGAFSMGAMTCTLTAHVATAICTKANTRSNINDSDGPNVILFKNSLNNAFFASVITFFSTIGMASLVVAATYLIYADIQAVSGFIGGSSYAALFLRTTSTLTFDSMVTAFNLKPPFREVIPPNAVSVVSSGVSVITGIVSEIFDSFAMCIIATAFLGAGLPYFAKNQFALCMFNHLKIDRECGPFGYPEDVSYASVICRNENFYMQYPSLENQTSVSRFVSIPFLLVAVTITVYFVVFTIIHLYERFSSHGSTGGTVSVKPFKKNVIYSLILCAVLLVIASSGIFFGIFGPSSRFRTSILHGFGKNTPKMVLNGTPEQCVLVSSQSATAENPDSSVLPKGIELKEDSYSPVFPSGISHGSAESVGLRLFACSCIGIIAGLLIAIMSFSEYFSKHHKTSSLGTLAVVFRRFSGSIVLQVPITTIILLTLILSYKLFGPYGIGIATIGYLSATGGSLTVKMVATMLLNAQSTETSIGHFRDSGQIRTFIHELNRITSMSAQIITNGSTTLSVLTTLFAVVQKSEIWISPRRLSGTADVPPSNLLFFAEGVLVPKVNVIVSMAFGVITPFLIAALFMIATFRSGLAIYVARRARKFLSILKSPSFVSEMIKISFQEGFFLVMTVVMLPLCIGFGFGKRAFISFAIGSTSISYILGTALTGGAVKRRAVVPPGGDNLENTMKQNAGACLQAAVKMATALGILLCTLMKSDMQRGWVGAVLFVISVLAIGLVAVWSHRRFQSMMEASGMRDESLKWEAPLRRVSPFYEDDSGIDPNRVNPSSTMGDMMRQFGENSSVPLSAVRIGIENGTVYRLEGPSRIVTNGETEEQEYDNTVLVPRGRVRTEKGVLRDDARYNMV